MAQRLYLPREQLFSDLGVIGAGYKLYSYETGTTTPLVTYSDTALSVANANPTIADSAGRLGDIFVNDLKSYDEILLVGSGKGIASVKTIKEINWKRKNLKQFKVLSEYYNSIINKCTPHRLH